MTNNYYNKPGENYIDDLNYIGYFPTSINPSTFYQNGYNPNNGYNQAPYMEDSLFRNQGFNPNYNYNYSMNPDYNQSINQKTPFQRVNSPEMFYPAIYRIIYPVVKSIIRSQGINYLNEKVLDKLTEEVFSIVDGDVISTNDEKESIDDNKKIVSNIEINKTQVGNSNTNNFINAQSNNHNQNTMQTNNQASNKNNNRQENSNVNDEISRIRDLLVKDIIRILIIREVESLNHMMPNYMGRY